MKQKFSRKNIAAQRYNARTLPSCYLAYDFLIIGIKVGSNVFIGNKGDGTGIAIKDQITSTKFSEARERNVTFATR